MDQILPPSTLGAVVIVWSPEDQKVFVDFLNSLLKLSIPKKIGVTFFFLALI